MDRVHLSYDKSFEGFLCLVFEIYSQRIENFEIFEEGKGSDLFSEPIIIESNSVISTRVLKGLVAKSSSQTVKFIYHCFLSELDGIENKLVHLIRFILKGQSFKIKDYSDPVIVDLHKVKKMIRREVHRMHAFVRFQETKDDMWVCEINPDFNVLPLIGKHFKERYPTLEWLVLDVNRSYGLYHKNGKLDFVTFAESTNEKRLNMEVITDEEVHYQKLWKQYFKSVNIKERNNPKLHLRHVPKRYWKFLIEK